jgi:hypothetical protein
MTDYNHEAGQTNCTHPTTRVDVFPPGSCEHFAKVICTECETTLCYKPHPRILARRQLNAVNIQKLSADSRLTAFERGFLTGLRNHKPTPRQQQILDALVRKYILNKGVETNDSENRNGAVLAECAA